MMEKKDLQKQQRRKRKDPESRDFKCKCGKSYLSYAAVYTHVKNKHNGDKEFEDSITKPEIIKQKRGRPRDKKKIVVSSETQILSICEETTLLIYEQLKEHKDKFTHHIVLEGNEEMNQHNFEKEYQRLNEKKEVKINLLSEEKKEKHNKNNNNRHQNNSEEEDEEEENKIFEKFLKGVIKHFSAEIAARTSYVINYFAELYEEINFEDQNEVDAHIRYLNDLDIWEGQDTINAIIYEAMIRWLDILRKEAEGGEE